MTSSVLMLKKINLSTDISKLNKSLSMTKEKKHNNNVLDHITSTTIFTSEIGFPFINNIVGMHALIINHITSLDQPVIYLIVLTCSVIDATLHYTLLFDVYKKAIGLPLDLDDNEIHTLKNDLIELNYTLMLFLNTENPTSEKWDEIVNSYTNIIAKKESLTNQTGFRKFAVFFMLTIILGIFIALRISGGYFILSHLIFSLGLTTIMLSPPGMIIMWSLIALYAFEGYQTRKNSIADFFTPLKTTAFDELEKNYSLLNQKISNVNNIDFDLAIDINQINAHTCSYLPINQLKIVGLFISEIGFPLINDFIGMNLLLIDHAAFLAKGFIYLISAILSYIDLTVFYAQIFPVLKNSIGLVNESTQEIKESRMQLRSLNEIADKLLVMHDDAEYELKLNQFFEHYKEISKLKDASSQEMIVKKCIEGALLSVFVALRVSGGYFILTNFYITLGITAFSLTPIGLGITWALIALYAYRGFGTRKTAITDLLYPLRMKEFNALEKKHNQLKLCVPGSMFHKNVHSDPININDTNTFKKAAFIA